MTYKPDVRIVVDFDYDAMKSGATSYKISLFKGDVAQKEYCLLHNVQAAERHISELQQLGIELFDECPPAFDETGELDFQDH